MSDLKPIAPLKFASAITPSVNRGERGGLEWIKIGKLFIDPAYQREVLEDGRKNVRNIAENFRWAYFTPLVVSPRPGGYAIIDGQHRAVAACTHGGIEALPCLVVHCTREEEARAFAVINGNITRPNTLQIYAAKLAAGDTKAQALKAVCDAAGVRVPRNIKLCDRPGDTLAIGALQSCLDQYGARVLTLALKLITETGDGNAGLVRAAIIHALCLVLKTHVLWLENPALLRATIESVGLANIYKRALQTHAVDGGTMKGILANKIVSATEREAIAREKARKVA